MLERFHSRMSCDTISYVRAYFPDSMVLIADTMAGIRTGYHSGDYHASHLELGNLLGFKLKFDATPNIKKQHDLILTGAYRFDPYYRTRVRSGVEFAYNFIPYSVTYLSSQESSSFFLVEGRKGDNRLMYACGSFDVRLWHPLASDTVHVYGDYNLKFYDPYSYP